MRVITLIVTLATLLVAWRSPRAQEEGIRDPNQEQQPESEPEPESEPAKTIDGYEAVLEKIREDFPGLITAALDPDELVKRLVLAARVEGKEEDPQKWTHVRLLAAEVLDAVGEPAKARARWQQIATTTRDDVASELKGRAFFEMGLHYLLRERYRDAWKYWRHLESLAPKAPFTRTAKRYEPFLQMVDSGGEVPDFKADFGKGVGVKKLSELRGHWVLLDFWKSTVPNAFSDAEHYRVALDQIRNAGWDGVLLSVNLDSDLKSYKSALKNWMVDYHPAHGGAPYRVRIFDWPKFRDSRGFKSPIVQALALPRVPMQLLVDPEGKLRFITEVKAVSTKRGDPGTTTKRKFRKRTPADLTRLIKRLLRE